MGRTIKRAYRKRLSIDIPTGIHAQVKEAAKIRNITSTRLVLRAIVEYMARLNKYT